MSVTYQTLYEQAVAERDRAIAEAALLREALELLQRDGVVSAQAVLGETPLARAAARVIECAEDMKRSRALFREGHMIAAELRRHEEAEDAAVDALRAALEGKP